MSDGRFATDLTQNVHRFARDQGGHVDRTQLLAAGLSQRTIDRWVRSGRLIRIYRGVYAVGHVQRNPINRGHAALLAGGERSALAGACGLVLWEVWRRWPSRWEIVIASDRRPSGLIVHRSATLLKRDVRTVQGLRVTSPARTLLDTAPRLTDKQRERAVNDLRLRGVLTNEQLLDVVERNARCAGAALLRPLIEIAQPEPTRSDLEDAFLKLVRTYDLPIPQINVYVGGERVDAYFPDHNLIVELDGWATHRRRFATDRRRDADILAVTGIPTVRLPYEDTTAPALIPTTVARLRALVSARNRMGPTLAAPRSG